VIAEMPHLSSCFLQTAVACQRMLLTQLQGVKEPVLSN
jgi:hypothetical protein